MDIFQLKLDLIQQVLHTQDEILLQQLLTQLQQSGSGTNIPVNPDLLHALLINTSEPDVNQADIEDVQRSISDIFEGK